MNEEFEIVKLDLNNIDKVKSVKKNPVVKATILSVLKVIPIIGELVDSTIDVFLTNFQNEKERNY